MNKELKVKLTPTKTAETNEENTEGRKDDTGKLPYELIAPEFLEAIAEILDFGQRKYAPRNWEKGMDWSRPFGALMRHAWAWWKGEEADPETGKSHLWHLACCAMFLVTYEMRGIGNDNRPKEGKQKILTLSELAKEAADE